MTQEVPDEGRTVPDSREMARNFLDTHLSNATKGDDFALRWLDFLRDSGVGERDDLTIEELGELAFLVDDYVQDRNLTRAFDLALSLVIGVVSTGLVALGAWLTSLLAEWNGWLGVACAGISFIVTFAFTENMAEFAIRGKESLKHNLEVKRNKIVESMVKTRGTPNRGPKGTSPLSKLPGGHH